MTDTLIVHHILTLERDCALPSRSERYPHIADSFYCLVKFLYVFIELLEHAYTLELSARHCVGGLNDSVYRYPALSVKR